MAGILGFGLLKRMGTPYLVTTQRLYIRRGMLSNTAESDDSEFRFVGIADPGEVVGAVDRAPRDLRGVDSGRITPP